MTSVRTALIVGPQTPATTQLRNALGDAEIGAVSIRPEEVTLMLPSSPTLDLILVAASLDAEYMQKVVALAGGPEPGQCTAVVVYADEGLDQLTDHIASGLDYVAPPFRAEVLLDRLFACQGQAELERSARDVANETQMIKYERELQIGREIQSGFLPHSLPVPPHWEIEARFAPAREVAGDFYDGFEMVGGRRIGFVIADVCDKGVGAALFMALIRSLLRNTAGHAGSFNMVGLTVEFADAPQESGDLVAPGVTSAGVAPLMQAIVGTNDYLIDNHLEQGYFATMFFGVLDPASGSLIYVNCGHNPPIVRTAAGEQIFLPPTGPALGLLPNSSFEVGHAQLGVGDTLFVYTDGVPEAKNVEGKFFSDARIAEVLSESVLGANELIERMGGELREHIGAAAQFDDITMMVLHRLDPADPAEPAASTAPVETAAPGR